MPDAYGGHGPAGRPPIAVGDALRALPLERPATSAWPAIAATLAQRRRQQRQRMWLAAAALLVAALALPSVLDQGMPSTVDGDATVADVAAPVVEPATVAAAPATAAEDAMPTLSRLMHESAQLEALIAATGDDAVGSGTALLLQAQLRERMQLVDALLGSTADDPASQHLLWQERVVLLRQMAGIDGGEQLLAAHGEGADGTLVMTF